MQEAESPAMSAVCLRPACPPPLGGPRRFAAKRVGGISAAMRAAVLLLGAWPALAMYDVFLAPERARAPAECPSGCARWADLAADGNTRDQADVNAKFRHLAPPPEAGRACAMPAYDPGESGPGWCYCRNTGAPNSEWGYCLDPLGSVPEQINLQFVDSDAGLVTVAFVTVDGHAPAAAVAQLGTSPTLAGAANVSGVTNFWTQAGSSRQYSFHFVPLSGLLPATTYFYRVASGAAGALWSATLSFTTRSKAEPLVFGIFGDMGVYPVNNMDVLRNSSLDFVVHMGDHAYQMSSDDGARGDGYMIAWEGVLTATPWLAVMGNRACHPWGWQGKARAAGPWRCLQSHPPPFLTPRPPPCPPPHQHNRRGVQWRLLHALPQSDCRHGAAQTARLLQRHPQWALLLCEHWPAAPHCAGL